MRRSTRTVEPGIVTGVIGFRSDRLNLVALIAAWSAMALLVRPVGDFPVQDDWAYGLAVRSLLDDGVYRIPDFVSADLGPLVHWGALFCWPFGFSFTALRISTLVMGAFGIGGVYFLFREVWSDKRLALVAAAAVLVNPIYFSLANTFMTDVPFVALISVAMALIVRGLRREDRVTLLAGLALCLVAVLVRQFALVIFGAFACAWAARRGLRPAEIVKALIPLAVGIAAHVGFNQWLYRTGRKGSSSGISDITNATFGEFVGEFTYSSAHELFNVINELGLFLLPIAVFCAATRIGRFSHERGSHGIRWPLWLALAFGAAIAWLMLADHRAMPLSGDTLHYFGIGPLMLRDTLLIGWNLPPYTHGLKTFWSVMTAFAIVGATMIAYAFAKETAEWFDRARRLRASLRESIQSAWLVIFFAMAGLAYLSILLVLATRHDLFDRYLLPLVVIVALALPAIGLYGAKSKWRRVAYAFVCAWLLASACWSVITTHDFLAWNRARWMALSDLMDKQHVSPRDIDGGYEFNGWYLYDPRYELHGENSWWWVVDDEYLIAAGPMPGYRIDRRLVVDRWWSGTAPDIFVLHRDEPP